MYPSRAAQPNGCIINPGFAPLPPITQQKCLAHVQSNEAPGPTEFRGNEHGKSYGSRFSDTHRYKHAPACAYGPSCGSLMGEKLKPREGLCVRRTGREGWP